MQFDFVRLIYNDYSSKHQRLAMSVSIVVIAIIVWSRFFIGSKRSIKINEKPKESCVL